MTRHAMRCRRRSDVLEQVWIKYTEMFTLYSTALFELQPPDDTIMLLHGNSQHIHEMNKCPIVSQSVLHQPCGVWYRAAAALFLSQILWSKLNMHRRSLCEKLSGPYGKVQTGHSVNQNLYTVLYTHAWMAKLQPHKSIHTFVVDHFTWDHTVHLQQWHSSSGKTVSALTKLSIQMTQQALVIKKY